MASVARNTAWLTLAKSLNVAVYAAFGLLLPRFTNLETNGVYTLMSNLLFFGSMAATFGIPLILVRGIAQEPERAPDLFVDARMGMSLGAILGGAALFGYLALEMALQGTWDSARLGLTTLVAGILAADAWAAAGEGVFQGFEQMVLPAKVEAATGCFKVTGGLLALGLLPEGAQLFGVYGAFLAGSAARAVFLTPRARQRFLPPALPRPSLRRALALFRESLGVALFRMLRMVRNRVDLFLLGLLIPAGAAGLMESGDLARGLYGQAFRVVLVFHTLTLAFNTAIFPGMVRAASDGGDRAGARSRFFRAVAYQAWWAAPLAAGVFLYAPAIAGWFGPEYRDGVPGIHGTTGQVLRILVFATLLDSVGGPVGMLVLGSRRMDRTLPWLGAALAGTSVVLNLLLIPRLGILGAAWASLAASGVEVVLKLFLVARLLGSPWRMLPRALPCILLAGGLGAILAAGPLAERPVLGSLLLAGAYAAATLMLGLVDPAVRSRLGRLLGRT